jgi:hypothetical protein
MLRILAIISLALSFVFDVWSITHGVWTWTPFLILGILLWCISSAWDKTPW